MLKALVNAVIPSAARNLALRCDGREPEVAYPGFLTTAGKGGALQAAEKHFQAVIPIRQPTERNLALSVFKAVRDSSPATAGPE